jgi:hypothetical protein
MKTYKQEIKDGVSELVKSQASLVYASVATISTAEQTVSDDIAKIIASNNKSNPGQFDLYYLESVLVSTGWNKNDDVFTPESTWAARDTPEDKQFNFMHNENDIIGHITSSYVLDKEGKKISANEDQAPDDFDIVTEAVLYNCWTDPDNRERMQQIIAEIEDGKWFVSMECLFADFDYALVEPNGTNRVVGRDEQSSFLTKHLRAYGGEGKYEGFTIGRALKNIAFSGKGLVSKPANPRSVIFEKSRSFIVEDITDKLSIGDIKMSDNHEILDKQIASLKEDLSAAKAENTVMKQSVEEAKDKEFASTVEAFEADVQAKNEAAAELEETIKSTQARIAELEDALAQSQNDLVSSQAKVDEMHQKEIASRRKAALVEAGFEDAEAEESLDLYSTLSDEAFDAIVAKFNWFDKKKKDDDKKDDKKEDKKEASVEASTEEAETEEAEAEEVADKAIEEAEAELEEAFEEVESSEAALVESDSEVDDVQATRASIASWLESNVLNK